MSTFPEACPGAAAAMTALAAPMMGGVDRWLAASVTTVVPGWSEAKSRMLRGVAARKP